MMFSYFKPFFSPYTLPHTSVGLTGCISMFFFSFENVDSFDLFAACYVPLNAGADTVLRKRGGSG